MKVTQKNKNTCLNETHTSDRVDLITPPLGQTISNSRGSGISISDQLWIILSSDQFNESNFNSFRMFDQAQLIFYPDLDYPGPFVEQSQFRYTGTQIYLIITRRLINQGRAKKFTIKTHTDGTYFQMETAKCTNQLPVLIEMCI